MKNRQIPLKYLTSNILSLWEAANILEREGHSPVRPPPGVLVSHDTDFCSMSAEFQANSVLKVSTTYGNEQQAKNMETKAVI